MKWLLVSALLMVIPSIYSENIFRLDITPEEAQQYIAAQSLDLNYARKIDERPLPASRNAEGDFIYQGRKISNPSDYVEREYLANQFHGQDGLGRALFGYSDWNQGRVEAINANGDVRGSYKYVDPHGKDFIANYWADSLGFHHEDNRPKVVLEPVTDTPAVQAAREEHFRKWREAADAANANPDPYSDVYNRNANSYDEDQARIDQANEIIRGSGSEKSYDRVQQSGKYQPGPEEATGEPRGFFYNFDYPVQLLHNVREKDDEQSRARRSTDNVEANKKSSEESKESHEENITLPASKPEIQSRRYIDA